MESTRWPPLERNIPATRLAWSQPYVRGSPMAAVHSRFQLTSVQSAA